ncbi:putative chromatin regulator PHD family [Helianthus annuus]|nr:putative chromatin regulator PHD family [Helianthus annuus]
MYSKLKEKNTEIDVSSLTVEELQHEHPLTLVDLQLMHRDYIEDDDEYNDNDLIMTQNFHCTCNRICGVELEDDHSIYKCSRCMYYVHADCATQKIEPFMFVFLPGLGKTKKNFKDVDHPELLHLPVDDESHVLSHQLKDETCEHVRDEMGLRIPFIHDDPLVLIHDEINQNKITSLHDPMNRIKLLCSACSRPITKMPFYKCSTDDDFVLHDWCTRLPQKLISHSAHPEHILWAGRLMYTASGAKCRICGLPCNGLIYGCFDCEFITDVNCAFMPKEITHEAHADHLLTRAESSRSSVSKKECHACRVSIGESETFFKCNSCDFYLDCRCALQLPKSIMHKFDKHPLQLSYAPIKDHKSQYFCEVCEEELDPGKWFYHCAACAQSIHSACALLILQSEQGVNSFDLEGVYKFINIKFGCVEKRPFHQHRMSLAPGTENDGLCHECGSKLQSHMIWKCLHCNFACHGYHEITPLLKPDALQRLYYISGGNKRMIKQRESQTRLEFYPSEMMRPETRDWKVVDDVQ